MTYCCHCDQPVYPCPFPGFCPFLNDCKGYRHLTGSHLCAAGDFAGKMAELERAA